MKALAETFFKRLVQKDLSLGWTAWHAVWEEKSHQRRQLKQAANRLTMPRRSAAFAHWRHDWDATQQATARKLQKKREDDLESASLEAYAELEQVRMGLQRKLDVSEKERIALLERLTALDGGAAAAERRMQEKETHEKEQRIQHLCGMIARRIQKKDLTRGWAAWLDMFEEKASRQRVLQAAAGRLMRPELAATFAFWLSDWERTKQREEMRVQQEAMREVQAKLQRDIEEMSLKLEAANRSGDTSGSNERVAAAEEALKAQQEKEEREREQRVKHMMEMVARRILKRDLSLGWTAWHAVWEEKSHQRRQLKQAANRLTMPRRSAAFAHWRHDWDATQQATARKLQKKREDDLESASLEAYAELEQVRMGLQRKLDVSEKERIALLERLTALDGGAAAAERRMQEKETHEKEQRIQHLCGMIARRIQKKDLTRGWAAWLDMFEEKASRQRVLQAAAGRLMRPELAATFAFWLSDWERTKLEAERAEHRRREDEAHRSREDLVLELKNMREELAFQV